MSRVLRESQRDFIQVERSGDETIFRNPRTLKEIRLSKDASPAERLKARQELQEVTDNPFEAMPAIKGLDLMARGGKELPQEPVDKEPYVNCGGDSAMRRKQLTLHDAWLARQQAKADRARQLADENRLADKFADKLAKAEPEPAPPVVTSDADWQNRMAATKELARVRGDALSTQEQIAAAQRAADDAWGIVTPPVEGGSNDS